MEKLLFPLKPVFIKEIWGSAPHSAFTDLCLFQKHLYVAFRESDTHQKGKCGAIRLIFSQDGENWHEASIFQSPGLDLRDPKLFVTPQNKLAVLFQAVKRSPKHKYLSSQSYLAESDDGINFSSWSKILGEHEWLWRLTFSEGVGYGAAYRFSNVKNLKKEWLISLYRIDFSNGIQNLTSEKITDWQIPGHPNETTLRFLSDKTMVALVRRDLAEDRRAWVGFAKPPYKIWTWQKAPFYFGGPNFIVLPNDEMIACGRILYLSPYAAVAKTCIASLDLDLGLSCKQILPSGGDTSYPGMALDGSTLWICYYSSHFEKSRVYLAKFCLLKEF